MTINKIYMAGSFQVAEKCDSRPKLSHKNRGFNAHRFASLPLAVILSRVDFKWKTHTSRVAIIYTIRAIKMKLSLLIRYDKSLIECRKEPLLRIFRAGFTRQR